MPSKPAQIAIALLLLSQQTWAGPTINRIRYRGGTINAKTNSFDWDTSITVNPDSIILVFSPHQVVRLKPSQVTSLSYGAEARRRVADVVSKSTAASMPGGPRSLFGLMNVPSEHVIGITFVADDGKAGAVLLEPDKRLDLAILEMLKALTGKPIELPP